jgi:hypothetical protein
MAISRLVRLSGLSLMLAAPLYLADVVIHPLDSIPGAMFDPRWTPIHIVEGVLYLLITLGVVGLYVAQAERVGTMGLAGFVLALFGAAFIVNEAWMYHAHLLPYMAAQHPEVLSPSKWYSTEGPLGAAAAVAQFHYLAQIGQLLLCTATVRAGLLPRWPAMLMAFGQAMFLVYLITPDAVDTLLIPVLVVCLFGTAVSYAWLGGALFRLGRSEVPGLAAVAAR